MQRLWKSCASVTISGLRTCFLPRRYFRRSLASFNFGFRRKEFQRMEEERIEQIRNTIWAYSNANADVCVADDEVCSSYHAINQQSFERTRKNLEQCNALQDLQEFMVDSGTGTSIPPPLLYQSFYPPASNNSPPVLAINSSTADRQLQSGDLAAENGLTSAHGRTSFSAPSPACDNDVFTDRKNSLDYDKELPRIDSIGMAPEDPWLDAQSPATPITSFDTVSTHSAAKQADPHNFPFQHDDQQNQLSKPAPIITQFSTDSTDSTDTPYSPSQLAPNTKLKPLFQGSHCFLCHNCGESESDLQLRCDD